MPHGCLFMDIGKVSALECVQSGPKRGPCLLKAIGDKGEMTFSAVVAYSKMYPEDRQFHAQLFDLGVAAFISQMRLIGNTMGVFKEMKRGDRFLISNNTAALKQLRETGFGSSGDPPPCRCWINSRGEPIAEPQDFLARHLAAALCVLSCNVYSGRESVDDSVDQILSICSSTFGGVSGADVDFTLDWHDKLEAVARTINHHIDIKDYSPNMSKIDQLLALYSNQQELVDRLVGVDTFADHLYERTMEVYASRQNRWKCRIGMVEPFRCARFPGTRHIYA